MKALRENLLSLLDGTHAQAWMSRADLIAKVGVSEEAFSAVFEQLRATRIINTCNIIRPDISIEAVWLTGSAKATWQEFSINPKKLPPSGSPRRVEPLPQPQSDTDKGHETMEAQPEKSIPQQVLDIIIREPGITPSALRSRFPTDKKANKAITNALQRLHSSLRIESRIDAGVARIHPLAKAGEPIRTRQKHPLPYKLATGDQAKQLAQQETAAPAIPASKPKERQPLVPVTPAGASRLTIGYFEDGQLVITAPGRGSITLTIAEAQRVQNFLARIKPEVACA